MRIVVEDFGGVDLQDSVRILRVAYRIKAMVRGTRSCVLLSVNSDWLSASTLLRMKHIADCVLSLSPVVDTSELAQLVAEPTTLVSLLKIEKLTSLGSLTSESGSDDLYTVRNKRKRLSIRSVEIDPDKEMTNKPTHGSNQDAF